MEGLKDSSLIERRKMRKKLRKRVELALKEEGFELRNLRWLDGTLRLGSETLEGVPAITKKRTVLGGSIDRSGPPPRGVPWSVWMHGTDEQLKACMEKMG